MSKFLVLCTCQNFFSRAANVRKCNTFSTLLFPSYKHILFVHFLDLITRQVPVFECWLCSTVLLATKCVYWSVNITYNMQFEDFKLPVGVLCQWYVRETHSPKKIILEHRLECWREKDYDWREQVRARTRKTYRDTIHASSNKIMRRLYPMPIPIFPSMSQWLCYISCPFVRTCFSSQYHPSNFHPYNIPWQEIDSCCWHSFVLPWYNRTCV